MKKHGFTMAEVLITMGIVGITAALIAPAIFDIMPDKNKIKVLNYYARAGNVTNELLDTDWIYYRVGDCAGLACTDTPAMPPYNDARFSGDDKYQNLLFDKLGIDGNGLHPDGSHWNIVPGENNTYRITINVDGAGAEERMYSGSTTSKINSFMFAVDQYGTVTPDDPLSRAYIANPHNTHSKKEDYAAADGYITEGDY